MCALRTYKIYIYTHNQWTEIKGARFLAQNINETNGTIERYCRNICVFNMLIFASGRLITPKKMKYLNKIVNVVRSALLLVKKSVSEFGKSTINRFEMWRVSDGKFVDFIFI